MNFETRLTRLEALQRAKATGECSCSPPLVLWPDQDPDLLDRTCSKCGRERVVLKVEYYVLAGPEGMEATIAAKTPEQRKETENAILTGNILLPKQEDYPPSPTALKEYHAEMKARQAENST